MIGKLKEAANSARLRAAQMWREHRERSEAKKATAALNSEHGHGRFFLLHVPATATILAAITEWYWAVLFCIEATGHVAIDWMTSTGSDVAAAGAWHFMFDIQSVAVFIGLVCATVPIVMLSMVWLPVQFTMRGSGVWRRGTVIAVGILANILVIVSGTVVMNFNRQDQVREALVIEQSADAGRAAIGARLRVAETELSRITAEGNTSNEARAARAGVAGWRTYVREAQRDPGVPAADRQRIERAMGSAEAADALRTRIEELTVQQAVSAPTAATAATVEDTVGRDLNTFAQVVEVWRPPFVAVICTLIGIFGAWWVLALMQGLNPRDVMRSGWADEGHRIEHHKDEPPIKPQPMRPAREVVTDAETGEELIKITPKPHWRKTKGKKQTVEFTPEIPPDETGVEHDGGGRVGSVAASESVGEGEADENGNQAEQQTASNGNDQGALEIVQNDSPSEALPEPELTEAERAEFAMLAAAPDEPVNETVEPASMIDAEPEAVEQQGENAEQDDSVDQTDLPAEREPEITGRSPETRDDRLLPPASVAAE